MEIPITFTPEAIENVRAMRVGAYLRCERLDAALIAESGQNMAETRDEYRSRMDTRMRDNETAKAEVWRNLASSLVDMLGLCHSYGSGRVQQDGHGLYVTTPGIVFGVNKSSLDGSISLNS